MPDRIVVLDFPNGRLRSVANPVGLRALADRIPTRFVLPVVAPATKNKVLLDPNDLGANYKIRLREISSQVCGKNTSVPNVSDRTREKLVGLRPVHAIVVLDFPKRPRHSF